MATAPDSELEALREVFAMFDPDGSGAIDASEFSNLLEKVGRDPKEGADMLKDVDPDGSGKVTFEEFVTLLSRARSTPAESADPKVLEFLRILEEYRVKCEAEGNYLEAGRASEQLKTLRKQEERRQTKALRARQLAEKQDVQIAHNMQYAEFNEAWDKYMQEYDQMAQQYIASMSERHAQKLREFQEDLHTELTKRPPKYSRELLDWRKREHLLAKSKKYAEAAKLKRVADELEKRERERMDEDRLQVFQQREAKFRQQQQAEMAALLKRIDGRRREHLKQRELDSKRLLQRNKNVQQVLESKQVVEAEKRKSEIKTTLAPPRSSGVAREKLDTGLGSGKLRLKKSTKRSMGASGGSAGSSADHK